VVVCWRLIQGDWGKKIWWLGGGGRLGGG